MAEVLGAEQKDLTDPGTFILELMQRGLESDNDRTATRSAEGIAEALGRVLLHVPHRDEPLPEDLAAAYPEAMCNFFELLPANTKWPSFELYSEDIDRLPDEAKDAVMRHVYMID